MFCMGFTMDLGKEKSAAVCAKRGVILLLAGFFLNILRGPIVKLVQLFVKDPAIVFVGMIDVLNGDILPFAGLAFLLMALLKKCKLKPWGIFIVSLVLSALATPFQYTDVGEPVTNAILGLFIGSYSESYFPLFHWFVFVAAGNVFRMYYTRIEDKGKFYKKALPISAVLSAAFLVLASLEVGPFLCLSDFCYYTWMNPCDAIGCIFCIITYMGVMWLLSRLVDKIQPKFRPLTYLAENLSVLYFIHWPLLAILEHIFMSGFELIPWPESDIVIFLYAIGFLALTIVMCEIYKKHWRKAIMDSLQKHTVVWVVVLIVLIVTCIVLSLSFGLEEIPSFLNEYQVNGIFYY